MHDLPQVPDDPSSLIQPSDMDAAPGTASAVQLARANSLLAEALELLGVPVPLFGPPAGGPAVGATQALQADWAVLGGMLGGVADGAGLGADPAAAARGYVIALRDPGTDESVAKREALWWQVLEHRAAVSVQLARAGYPLGAASPGEACRAADELLVRASQVAHQAANLRLLLSIPADVFAGRPVPAAEHYRAVLQAFTGVGLAMQDALERVAGLLPLRE